MAQTWTPILGAGDTFRDRIADAIERDVRDGILCNGTRLPAQRMLAKKLGVSVGTITTAYAEVEKRGIARGYVGRGTYIVVANAGEIGRSTPEPVIDLGSYIIPHQAATRRYATHRGRFSRHLDVHEALSYGPSTGLESVRRASARWLRQIANLEVPWQRVVVTSGGQHALALALLSLCRAGDTILCEAITSPGMKNLAASRGYLLQGVKLDAEGVLPEDLERAIVRTKAKVLYVMPTVQMPTGRSMSDQRRKAITEIARRRKIWVVEGDNFALFGGLGRQRPLPLAAYMPERCFYTGSVSQSIAPGLRVGFLVCPSENAVAAVGSIIRATIDVPPTLGGLLFQQWIEDGSAFEIAESVKEEVTRRIAIARELFGAVLPAKIDSGPNLWFPMAPPLVEEAVSQALQSGVAVMPFTNMLRHRSSISGLGVCLGAAKDASELAAGIRRLKLALFPEL